MAVSAIASCIQHPILIVPPLHPVTCSHKAPTAAAADAVWSHPASLPTLNPTTSCSNHRPNQPTTPLAGVRSVRRRMAGSDVGFVATVAVSGSGGRSCCPHPTASPHCKSHHELLPHQHQPASNAACCHLACTADGAQDPMSVSSPLSLSLALGVEAAAPTNRLPPLQIPLRATPTPTSTSQQRRLLPFGLCGRRSTESTSTGGGDGGN